MHNMNKFKLFNVLSTLTGDEQKLIMRRRAKNDARQNENRQSSWRLVQIVSLALFSHDL